MRCLFRSITSVLLTVALIATAAVFVPRLAHICDNCDTFFLGTGYTANVASNALTYISGQEDKILCEDCAAKEHALAIAAGKSLSDFKRPLFEEEEE